MQSRLVRRILWSFAAIVVGAGLVLVAALEVNAQILQPSRERQRLSASARALGARVDPARFGPYLRRLTSEDEVVVEWRNVSSMTGRFPNIEPFLAAVDRDPLDHVMVLDSAQETVNADLNRVLWRADTALENAPTYVAVLVTRGGDQFIAAHARPISIPIVAATSDPPEARAAIARCIAQGVESSSPVFLDGNEHFLAAYAPLRDETGAVVGALEAASSVESAVQQQQFATRSLAVEIALTLLLGLVLGGFSLRPLAARLATLRRAIDSLQSGRLDVTLSENGGDELSEIARAFNAMTRQLRERERMRALLEQTMSSRVAKEMLQGGPALEGSVHEATVMFVDVRGFTTLSEEHAAREVIRFLNEYFDRAAPEVERNGGFVDKFLGDGMVAVFGVPDAMANDALAAVKAASGILERVRELNATNASSGAPPLEVGIGVNTGPLVSGALGSRDRRNYSVIGTTVNVAARLCAKAGPGEIVLGETTYLRVKNRVDVHELEPLVLKGVTFPARAFQVISIRETTAA